ncbi:MAG: hypothetical protein P4L69_01885, partial [Desulfosporosinus sp.]|nr:hypothetical protein [Desulfosporosinus sp.]
EAAGWTHNAAYIEGFIAWGESCYGAWSEYRRAVVCGALSIGESNNLPFIPEAYRTDSWAYAEGNVATQVAVLAAYGGVRSMVYGGTKYGTVVALFDEVCQYFVEHMGNLSHDILSLLAEYDDSDRMIRIFQIIDRDVLETYEFYGGSKWLPVLANTDVINVQKLFDCVLKRNKLDQEFEVLLLLHSRGANVNDVEMIYTSDPRVMNLWLERNVSTDEHMEQLLYKMDGWKMEMVVERHPELGPLCLHHAANASLKDTVVNLVERCGVRFKRDLLKYICPDDRSILKYLNDKFK